jgi:hypothetical protein
VVVLKFILKKQDRNANSIYLTQDEGRCRASQAVAWGCSNGKYGASTLRFPHMEEFLWKLSAVWTCALKMFTSPVLGWESLKNIGLKGHQIISLPRAHTSSVGPGPVVCSCEHGNWTFWFDERWGFPGSHVWLIVKELFCIESVVYCIVLVVNIAISLDFIVSGFTCQIILKI